MTNAVGVDTLESQPTNCDNKSPVKPDVSDLQADHAPSDLSRTLKATLDLLSVFISINLLSVPNALAIAGWILGSILILFCTAASFFVVLLCGSMASRDSRWINLDNVGEDAFGGFSRTRKCCACGQWALRNSVRLVLLFELLVWVADMAFLSVDFILLLPAVRTTPFAWYYEWLMMLALIVTCTALARLPENLLRSLNAMATVATCMTLLLFLIFAAKSPEPTDIYPSQPSRLGLSFVLMNSFAAYPVYSKTYTTVQSKRLFNRVAVLGQISTTIFVCLIGVAGYLFYGQNVSSELLTDLVATTSDAVSIPILIFAFLSSALKMPFVMTILFGIMDRCIMDLFAGRADDERSTQQLGRRRRRILLVAQLVLPALAAAMILGLPDFQLLLNFLSAIAGFLVPILICAAFLRLIETSGWIRNCALVLIVVFSGMIIAEIASTILLRVGVI